MSTLLPPRGVRNNNPGNIRHSNDKWVGKSAEQTDPDFVQFEQPQYGIRALAKILLTYDKKGLNTVAKIIGRWAPSNENDTAAYVKNVADQLGVSPDEPLDIDDYTTMYALVTAIIKHENRNYEYPEKLVRDALRMAGVHGTPQKKLTERGGFKTQVVATTASGLAVASTAAEPLAQAAERLSPFAEGSEYIGYLKTALMTIAGLATFAGIIGIWLKVRKGL